MASRNDLFTYTYVREEPTSLVFKPLTEPELEVSYEKSRVDTSASSLVIGNQYLFTRDRNTKNIVFEPIP
jgi:hypothetical protein